MNKKNVTSKEILDEINRLKKETAKQYLISLCSIAIAFAIPATIFIHQSEYFYGTIFFIFEAIFLSLIGLEWKKLKDKYEKRKR